MTDNLTPPALARFYGFARTRTVSECLAALSRPPGRPPVVLTDERGRLDTAAATDILHEEEAQAQQREPSTEPEASQEVTELVLVSNTKVVDDVGSTTDETPAPATIEVSSPPCTEGFAGGEAESAPKSRRKKSRPRRRNKAAPAPAPSQHASRRERHKELCGICISDYREEIDDAFINWESVNSIAREFNIERRAVYRHAHATGLFPKRDRNIRRALGLIIHRADKVQGVTADSVIRAIHMLAHINEAGEWIAPPAHVIVSSGTPRLANNNTHPAVHLLDTRCQPAKKLNP